MKILSQKRSQITNFIVRENLPSGLTCRHVIKKVYGNFKNFPLYFTHLPGSPQWTGFAQNFAQGVISPM